MFVREHFYARLRRRSIDKARAHILLDGQRHWRVDEPGPAQGIGMPGRAIFAQNDAYLELCNPGWERQWQAVFGGFFVVLPALFIIWSWYGFAVHPLLFEKIIFFWKPMSYTSEDWPYLLFGWLLVFPLAIACVFLLWVWFCHTGGITAWFTHARGRIRFNRLTRQVYVLRPPACGGNRILAWDRLVALLNPEAFHPWGPQKVKALALYHPPLDSQAPTARGEDCVFVGTSLYEGAPEVQAAGLWEYIRLYMQEGPTVDEIPPNAPEDFRQVPRYPPHPYSTYCGLPSAGQYGLEMQPGVMETTCHMISQMTCSWPRFKEEWQSDSGLGEPEDDPVKTGAVMTALVYRAQGRLTARQEVAFLARHGTPEALAEARAKLGRGGQ